jgi:hypothetical protein
MKIYTVLTLQHVILSHRASIFIKSQILYHLAQNSLQYKFFVVGSAYVARTEKRDIGNWLAQIVLWPGARDGRLCVFET